MAKYGLNTFNRRFTIDAEKTYGTLTFTGGDVIPEILWLDPDGNFYDEQSRDNTRHQKPTGEIASKYIMAYSSVQGEVMDIKVSNDFDINSLPFRAKIKLIDPIAIPVTNVTTTGSGNNTRSFKNIVFPAQAQDVEVIGSKASQPQQPKPENKQG